MLFGAEQRFYKKTTSLKKGSDIQAFMQNSETASHVGPGTYYASQEEDRRNGWIKKSFSNRESMTPTKRRVDRNYTSTFGKMVPTGIALPSCPTMLGTPGPGYYAPPLLPATRPKSASRSGMGTSSRINAAGNFVVKDGVLIYGESKSTIGPGYYSPEKSKVQSLLFESHNIHAQNGTPVKSVVETSLHLSRDFTASSILNSSASKQRSKSAPRRPSVSSSFLASQKNDPRSSFTDYRSPNPYFSNEYTMNNLEKDNNRDKQYETPYV